MNHSHNAPLKQAVMVLCDGGIIAYPTESVFGLGCDPRSEQAVNRIVKIKQRPLSKGLILVASRWEQLAPWITNVPPVTLNRALDSWPGPVTWIFPTSSQAPHWVHGGHNSIAVRISAHPTVRALCDAFNQPIISTSANRHQEPPCTSAAMVRETLGKTLDYVLDAPLGTLPNPTPIYDVLSGNQLR